MEARVRSENTRSHDSGTLPALYAGPSWGKQPHWVFCGEPKWRRRLGKMSESRKPKAESRNGAEGLEKNVKREANRLTGHFQEGTKPSKQAQGGTASGSSQGWQNIANFSHTKKPPLKGHIAANGLVRQRLAYESWMRKRRAMRMRIQGGMEQRGNLNLELQLKFQSGLRTNI